MTIQDAYTDWAATYDTDRNLTRDLDQRVTRDELANFPAASILELGCGTGKNTSLLATMGAQVRALDFSPGMIEKARSRITSPNVTFDLADLTKPWPCDDRSFNLIVCNLVLEHIKDLDFIFAEASRVLIRGGHFFVCELHPFRQYQGTVARFQRAEQTEIPAFIHHLTDFTKAAAFGGFTLEMMKEWWHEEDQAKPPRLVSFLFVKLSD